MNKIAVVVNKLLMKNDSRKYFCLGHFLKLTMTINKNFLNRIKIYNCSVVHNTTLSNILMPRNVTDKSIITHEGKPTCISQTRSYYLSNEPRSPVGNTASAPTAISSISWLSVSNSSLLRTPPMTFM